MRTVFLGLLLIAALAAFLLSFPIGSDSPPVAPRDPLVGAAPPPPDLAQTEALPTSGISVDGLVLDGADGSPVVGARVRLADRETSTDSKGHYALRLHELPERCFHRIDAEGYLVRRRLPSPDRGVKSWRLDTAYLERIRARVPGIVTDVRGDPLAGAFVELWDHDLIMRTDSSGSFGPVPVGQEPIEWTAYAPGHPLLWADYVPGEPPGEMRIVLPDPVWATGVVVDGEGRPLPDVAVNELSLPSHEVRCRTDHLGRFRMPVEAAGTAWLCFEKEGYLSGKEDYDFRAGAHVRVVMHRPATFAGRLLTSDGKPPGPGYELLHLRVRDTRTAPVAADGTFRFDPLLPGPCKVRVHREDSPLQGVEFDLELDGTGGDRVFRLPPARKATGRVLLRKTREPVSGMEVAGTITDSEGRFELMLEAPLEVRAHRVTLRPGESVEILVQSLARVAVLVTDPAGQPVPGALAWAWSHSFRRAWTAVCDTEGRAVLTLPIRGDAILRASDPVHGRGDVVLGEARDDSTIVLGVVEEDPPRWFVRILDEAGEPIPDAWFRHVDRKRPVNSAGVVPVVENNGTAGAPGREHLYLDWERPDGETIEVRLRRSLPVRARVLDEAGRPVRDMEVSSTRNQARTDLHGRVVIEGHPVGESVRLHAVALASTSVEALGVPGGPEVVLRMSTRGTILVRLRGPVKRGYEPTLRLAKTPWAIGRYDVLTGSDEAYWHDDGDAVRIDAPEGRFALDFALFPGDFRLYPEVRVRAGHETVLDYDFPTLGAVTGRVLGPDGAPVPNARIELAVTGEFVAETGAEGRFVVPDSVPAQAEPLRIISRGHAVATTPAVDLTGREHVEVRLTRGGLVKGVVRGPNGEPRNERVCWLQEVGPPRAGVASREEDGTFQLPERLPAGRARLRVTDEDRDPVFVDVEVREGATTKVEIRVR